MKAKKGFTLVEILIVVVILGILAAIVIPQFTEASTEAKTSSLCTDLQTMRSQIELYKIQHSDALPSAAAVGLVNALTTQTDADGAAYVAGTSTTGPFGPYLQKIPTNAFNGMLTFSTAAATPAAADNTTGWFFNTTSGEVRPNDTVDAAHWSL